VIHDSNSDNQDTHISKGDHTIEESSKKKVSLSRKVSPILSISIEDGTTAIKEYLLKKVPQLSKRRHFKTKSFINFKTIYERK